MIKPILNIVIMLVLIFLFMSGISIQFNPFRISFSYPVFGAGIVLIAIGIALCCGNVYYKGMEESGADYVIDYKKKETEKGNENVDD